MQSSPDTISTKFAIHLPDEVIFHIVHFLSPREVVRFRLVSKQFNGVTRDARLWRAFYINSPLPRPPGPFIWQSTQFLESVLVHSALVSQTWTSQPISVVSRVRGPRLSTKSSPVSTPSAFLFGRLFIWCEGDQLLAQDVETGLGQLLWQSPEPISSVSACSMTISDSERVFIGLRHVDQPVSHRTPIKLLEFPLQDDVRLTIGPVTFEMDLPEYVNFPLSASTHFLYFDGGVERVFGQFYEPVLLDARTRVMYRFPIFSSGLDEVILRELRPWWPGFTLLSGGHIVVFRPWSNWDHQMTLIQAFLVPESAMHLSDADAGQLRLTHEVLVERCFCPSHHLRGAIVDPITGNTNIRLLSPDARHGKTRYLCVDVTIPPINPESAEVLPIFISTQELFVLSGLQCTVFLNASCDGHGRGIVTMATSGPHEPEDVTLLLYKFSIDVSGDECAAVVSEPTRLDTEDVYLYAHSCIFDGVRGRICHDREKHFDFYDLMVLSLN